MSELPFAGGVYELSAKVSSDSPKGVEPALRKFVGGKGTINVAGDGFEVPRAAGEGARAGYLTYPRGFMVGM